MADENINTAPADGADNAGKTQVSAASDAGSGSAPKDTANNGAGTPPAFDPQKSYESIAAELGNVTKSYKALQAEFTRRNQDNSEVRKQLEGLHKLFQEATKEEISPEEFMKSLQKDGVKAFDPLREQWVAPIKEDYNKQISELQSQRLQDRNALAVMRRELDTKNYPDWVALKPAMNAIVESPNCPIDWSTGDLDAIYDTLYKLAKDSRADESVKKAKEIGAKEEQSRAAKEAAASVAGGGKTAGSTTPDLEKVKDISKLREMVAAMHGVADR